MTPKLKIRLARLEGDAARPATTVDPVLATAWLHTMSIALGGFPLPWQDTLQASGRLDTVPDGFARALGYADQVAMEVEANADHEEWSFRLNLAHTALVERFGGETKDSFRLACRALDEIAAAKARGVAYEPKLEIGQPDPCLHRALLQFGVSADALPATGQT